ncbi:MAG: hypothetical protein AB8H80_03950 [Planctomycetota bacterium]
MKTTTGITVALALLAAAPADATAQSKSKLKRELRTMEKAAKKDPEKLFEAATWASEKELDKDAKRILQKVLKMAPDHAEANKLAGNVQIEGKWLPKAEADKLREAAMEAEYAGKGYKKVDGLWIEPELVEDAKKGIFHHGDEIVTRDEKLALMTDKARHPITGRMIDKKQLDKAKEGYFQVAGGKWVDRKEADEFHSSFARPWVFRSYKTTIMSTLPLEEIEKIKVHSDDGVETAAPFFGGRELPPALRPVIMVAATRSEYTELGQSLGDGTDVAGAFLITEDATFSLNGRVVRPAICENEKDWGSRYIRHAAALAYINAIAEESGADLPLWFVHGVGSLTSRFHNDADAGWFGKQHIAKGGVSDIRSFFNDFELSSDLQPKQIGFNLYQAGLLLSYATRGGNEEATNAMLAVTASLSGEGKGSASKAISKLEKVLAGCKDGVTEHLKKLVAKSPQ